MVESNGLDTEPLQQGVSKLDPKCHEEHSHLLAKLENQQAEHERRVEQMLQQQLDYIAQMVSSGKRHINGNHTNGKPLDGTQTEGSFAGGSYTDGNKSHDLHSGAKSSKCSFATDQGDSDKDPDEFNSEIPDAFQSEIPGSMMESETDEGREGRAIRKTTVARSSWRPSVKSLTELEQTYAKDKNRRSMVDYAASDCLNDIRHCRFQHIASRITRQRLFEFGIQGLIIANGIVLGIQQDWVVRHLGEPLSPGYAAIDLFFAICFSLELVLRIVASGASFLSCWNPDIKWNVFDTLLVLSAVLEIVFDAFTDAIAFDVSAGRMLRVLRLVRVVRVIRVLRFFKDLRIMVLSIAGSLKPLGFALLLLSILIYVIAVCFMQFATEELLYLSGIDGGRESDQFKALHKAYGSLFKASYTLFMSISGGLNWGDGCAPLLAIHPILGFIFILYIAFAVFCVLNVITGIFVEEATKITSEDEENMLMHELANRRRFIAEAKRFFEEADKDNSGELSWPEFRERVEHVRFQKLLDNLGIDVVACGARNVFELFDFDGNGAIAISEFTSGLQQMRGNARSFDIVGLRYEQRMMRTEIERLSEQVAESCCEVLHRLRAQDRATAGGQLSEKNEKKQGVPAVASTSTGPAESSPSRRSAELAESSSSRRSESEWVL